MTALKPYAVCWCALGALHRVAQITKSSPITARVKLSEVIGGNHVANWNDAQTRTQAEVVAALRKASELAKAEGQ